MTPPLSGHDARILDLLMAGRTFDDVCEIGRYRGTWRPSAVHRVVAQWLPERRPARIKPAVPDPVPLPASKPPPRPNGRPRENLDHGTEGRYQRHRRDHEPSCEPCRLAHNAANLRRKRSA